MIISPDPEFADDKTFLNLFMGRYFWLEIARNESISKVSQDQDRAFLVTCNQS